MSEVSSIYEETSLIKFLELLWRN